MILALILTLFDFKPNNRLCSKTSANESPNVWATYDIINTRFILPSMDGFNFETIDVEATQPTAIPAAKQLKLLKLLYFV